MTKIDEDDTSNLDASFELFGANGVSCFSVLEAVAYRESTGLDDDNDNAEWRCCRTFACRGVEFALLE